MYIEYNMNSGGIELVRTIIFQLVLAVAFFKGIFETLSLTKITRREICFISL